MVKVGCIFLLSIACSITCVGKVLKTRCVDVLNDSFKQLPSLTARFLIVHKRIDSLQKELEKIDDKAALGQEKIKEKLVSIFNPIKGYMKDMKQNSWVLRTILTESLDLPLKGNLDTISLTTQDDYASYMLKYLNSDNDDIVDFMQTIITTTKELKSLCSEVKKVTKDLQDNFSHAVKKEYASFVKKVNQTSKDDAVIASDNTID